MHLDSLDVPSAAQDDAALRAVLRAARSLHHAAISDSLAASLPVLRRLLASGIFVGMSLPTLHRGRHRVRRKHLLRLLAVEAGAASWEHYRPQLRARSAAQLPHFDIVRRSAGYPNSWFSSLADAEAHAAQYGGRALAVGRQAVVLNGP